MIDNKFYTTECKEKLVSKQEFIEFLKSYPRPLERDVYAISDPPTITYNDFQLANRWPYSVVARTWLYDDKEGRYFYMPPEQRQYYIVDNFQEVFESKTGYMAKPGE